MYRKISLAMEMFRYDPMTKLQTPEMKKKMTPMLLQCMSVCGLCYSVVVTSLIFLTAILLVLPVTYPDRSAYQQQVTFLVYMFFNIAVNLLFVSQKKSIYRQSDLARLPDPSWKKCPDCDHNTPPRAHHCPLCRHCILRRDHHCFFTASCIGFENQRYFLVFCFYCGVGSAYCLYLLYDYVQLVYSTQYSYPVIHYLLPLVSVKWMFGYVDFAEFYIIFVGWLCLVSAVGSFGIFVWQFFLAATGLTTYEFTQRKWMYRHSILHNLRSVFGPFWPISFIIPVPCIKIPGDGIDWNLSKCV